MLTWSDDLLAEIDGMVVEEGYGPAAEYLTEQLDCYIHPEQLRGARRRWQARRRQRRAIGALEPAEPRTEHSTREPESDDNPIFSAWAGDTIVGIPEPVQAFQEPCMTLAASSFLVLADIHAPYQNKVMLERAMHITQKRFPHVRDCVVAGDLFNFERISRFGESGPSNNTGVDIRSGGAILRALLDAFNVWVFPGNHDMRLAKRLGSEYDFSFVVNGAVGGGVRKHELYVSNLSYMRAGAGSWLVLHPTSYSKLGGKTPAEIAELEQCNVVGSHNHVQGMMLTPSGKFIGVDPGHLTDPELHWYHHQNITKHARWSSGFVVVSKGYPYLFGDAFTDWPIWV